MAQQELDLLKTKLEEATMKIDAQETTIAEKQKKIATLQAPHPREPPPPSDEELEKNAKGYDTKMKNQRVELEWRIKNRTRIASELKWLLNRPMHIWKRLMRRIANNSMRSTL